MSDIVQDIIDYYSEESVPLLESMIRENTSTLQVAAAQFMKNCIAVKGQIDSIKELSRKLQEKRHSIENASISLPQEYQRLFNARKNLMTTALWHQIENNVNTFQAQLNELLGQSIKTVYVRVSGRQGQRMVNLYELPLRDVTKPSISSNNTIVGRYSLSLAYLQSQATNLSQQLASDDPVYYQLLSDTYLEALARYEKIRTHQYSGFYWRERKGKSGFISVTNKGDIAEAFANAALGKKKILMNTNIEGNLKRFAKLVVKVDNTSGLLYGDIESQDPNIQYAIKTAGASTMGVTQAIQLAQEILSGQIIDKIGLQKKQQQYLNQGVARNEIVGDINNELNTLLQTLTKYK